MILKSIKLSNIRSYTSQKIEFPQGSLLLSGDIGSGKSTVLLAIEFVLFGSKPAELPASSLLRHGKKEGSVELNFELNGKNIFIKRNLKRSKKAIKQDIGYIIVDEVKKDLSPVEMKSEIFNLLGYPEDLVSKGKDLIYRYTVYTPQEEMKRILLEDKDTRLDTLRKVFNIDKYKKIRENSAIFVRAIKEKKREIEGFVFDLLEKKKAKEEYQANTEALQQKIKYIAPIFKQLKELVDSNKETISLLETKVTELNKLKRDWEIFSADLRSLLREREQHKERAEKLNIHIKEIKHELDKTKVKDDKEIKQNLEALSKKIKEINMEKDKVRQKMSESHFIISKSREIIEKISQIEECPLCLQHVKHEHKSSISEKESITIKKAEEDLTSYSKKEKELAKILGEFETEKEKLRDLQNQISMNKLKQKNLNDKQEEIVNLNNYMIESKKNIGQVNSKKIEISKKIEEMKNAEDLYKKSKKEFDAALEQLRKIEIQKAELEKEKESVGKMLDSLEKEIQRKTQAKEKLQYLLHIQNWLENFFVSLMGTMEKHIMLHVHREFNQLFTEWFNTLIEDETISVRLDDEFTPIVEQNGYETNVENLSGGEKTSIALSYRLALNKVINDVIADIQTKGIIMLDEPTDGFSSEQLDKVRDVLEQLQMKQIIIVSHESKIESYVDTVLKVGKQEHVSSMM